MVRYQPDRVNYKWSIDMQTRLLDNAGGHLNNSLFYAFYEHAVARFCADNGVAYGNTQYGRLILKSSTEYLAPVHGYPDPVTIGLGVRKLGRSSIDFEFGVFQGEGPAKAVGYATHVFMDKNAKKPCEIPAELRSALEETLISPTTPTSIAKL
ncbi:hypothetical protein B9G98_04547 [Wickerhamiella sorbophila]|uniref:Thioesterase domain-containing protein n=1 Tax=Wickerhamiella sorbophila TaxID=45607 RepID=A0A2T0FPN5_9ASCO|nr:hypothetical protein B9G98_04547 [Wickerhamiella sorbophila]PRT56927.1 hypothetical protein B9G98_04547 [Wickerhamiella sorbophila]